MTVRTFKDLLVWQRAFQLTLEVYRETRGFPDVERYGMVSELRKTARSVVYNIAEGHKRKTTADYLRLLGIASGSAGELETQMLLGRELGYLSAEQASNLLGLHAEVDRMLDSLIRKLQNKIRD